MPSRIGHRLGHFRIVEKIGEGGMGEVYRATDTNLGRDVALKFVSATLTDAPERLLRFEREARFLASLNHPNIATLYGFEKAEDARFLVMELVSGETLAERIEEGPLPLEEAVPLFQQIAEALEAAHEKGVIHRDLKPANVKITAGGQVKVLDFGLAKALGGEASTSELSQSPTFVKGGTETGVLLGTAAYMSPEQARGKAVDKRTDVWSFGCVFYETLTGRKAFAGETVSDTIARILTQEPDWKDLPEETPRTIRLLLRRCLEKDVSKRLRHVDPIQLEAEDVPSPKRRNPWPAIVPFLVGALAAGMVVWSLKREPAPTPHPLVRMTLALEPNEKLVGPDLAFSPDGTRLAYVATRGDKPRIYLRDLSEGESKAIPGTEGGSQPFFSPDGEWLGFFAEAKLKKISLRGGPAIPLADASSPKGASWGPDDTIIFAPAEASGLFRASADAGTPSPLTLPDLKHEVNHAWPEILPGGRAVAFSVRKESGLDIVVQSFATNERRTVIPGAVMARYGPSGHLVYFRDEAIFAVPFDVEHLETTGPSVPVADGVAQSRYARGFAVSSLDWLVYGSAPSKETTLVWVDRTGAEQPLRTRADNYFTPRLSPDGQRVALYILASSGNDVWVYDIPRDSLARLTFDSRVADIPVWSPNGKQVAIPSGHVRSPSLLRMNADGSGFETLWKSDANTAGPESWSPDGGYLAFYESRPETDGDISVLSLEGERNPRPFIQTAADEGGAKFSPDGRFLAYVSNASGRPEIYVESFPGPGGKWQISSEGGKEPVWARTGKELFYRGEDWIMAVSFETQPAFAPGKPRALFEDRYKKASWFPANYDVSPDGHFLMLKPSGEGEESSQLNAVQNWAELLKRSPP